MLDPGFSRLRRSASAALLSSSDEVLEALLTEEYGALSEGRGDGLVTDIVAGAVIERRIHNALPILNQMLINPITESIHEDLAEALGNLGDASSVPFLSRSLSSKEPGIRAKSVRSLVQLAGSQVFDLLPPMLDDPSDTVRENTVRAIADTREPAALDILRQVAANPGEDISVRLEAIKGLGTLGDPRALPVLKKLEQEEKDDDVRDEIADALSVFGDH